MVDKVRTFLQQNTFCCSHQDNHKYYVSQSSHPINIFNMYKLNVYTKVN